MAANVLNSKTAIQTSIFVVRAFMKIREMVGDHFELKKKIDALEKKYDSQFQNVFEVIRKLLEPPKKPKKEIGFHTQVIQKTQFSKKTE